MFNKQIQISFFISTFFFVSSILFLTIFHNKLSRQALTEQIQHRQQLAVRTGAKSIETLLSYLGKNIVILTNEPTQKQLIEFVDIWKDNNVVGVIAVDKNGKVVAASNREEKVAIGQTVIERGYFKWAQTAVKGSYKIFPPIISKLGSSKGNYILTISSPIIKNQKFDGVITTAVLLSDLAKGYLDNIGVLDSSQVYLITNQGEIVYSDVPELTGRNIENIFDNDFLGKDKVIEILSNEIKKEDETKFKLAMPNFETDLIEPYLVSTAPVSVSGQLWKLVVVTPEKDLNAFTYKIFNSQILAIFVIFVIFVILTTRASRNSGYQEAVKDEHKLHKINS